MCFDCNALLFAALLLKSILSPPFQALQYLRKLCNHPSLVLTPQHPEYKRITEELASQNSNLRDIQHAPKLSALKQVKALSLVLSAAPSKNIWIFIPKAYLKSTKRENRNEKILYKITLQIITFALAYLQLPHIRHPTDPTAIWH